MKLSELVNFYNELCKLSIKHGETVFVQEFEKIDHVVHSQQVQFTETVADLQAQAREIANKFENFEATLIELKKQYKDLILDHEKPWYTESYRLYDEEMLNETLDDIRNRTTSNLSADTQNFYFARISKYNSWKHTALVIRPGFEPYINHMVGCDPLFIVDVSHELLAPALTQFNEQYQRRLRSYTITERDHGEILGKLPDAQFGFVLAYNYFNFRPFEVIKQYLEEIYKKLQPGGVLAMTFNDCDRSKAVMLAEQKYCCYTPGYLVSDLAASLGFEKILSWHNDGPSTWLELKKPGHFESLRGGQALAKILPKSIAESK